MKFEIGEQVKVVKGDPSTVNAVGKVVASNVEKRSGFERYLVEGDKMWAAQDILTGEATPGKQYYYDFMLESVGGEE